MTSRYSATLTVDASKRTRAIFESISTDESFYPENPVITKIHLDDDSTDGVMIIIVESDNLAHLRANLNATLRLIKACYNAIESTDVVTSLPSHTQKI